MFWNRTITIRFFAGVLFVKLSLNFQMSIFPTYSSYASLIVSVRKKYGITRLYVDYRELNNKMYPIKCQ